jgi:hypothetical protein
LPFPSDPNCPPTTTVAGISFPGGVYVDPIGYSWAERP